MLKTYLDLQQRQLHAEGDEKRRLQERHERERARQRAIEECCERLTAGSALTESLSLQNLAAMRRQLRQVAAFQAQQEALANIDVTHQTDVVRARVRRVKSLEQIIQQRLALATEERLRKEQKALEDLLQRTHKPY